MGPGYGWWWHGSWGWLGMLLAGLIFLLFLAGLVALVIFLVARSQRNAGPSEGGESRADMRGADALRILQERYARGEITKEQYDEMRQDILT